MKFYDKTKAPLETRVFVIGLGTALLQTRDGTTCLKDIALDNTFLRSIPFASKSLTSAECRYSNIEREALGMLHALEKFHNYCFSMEVIIITDHKPHIGIFKKDVTTLSESIQCILLRIHKYRVTILYKPGPEIFIADWLSRQNHKENKDAAIHGMDIRVDAIQASMNVPECMLVQQIQQATALDEHLQQLKGFIIAGWPESKEQLDQDIRMYWSFRDDMTVIDDITMKGTYIVIPEVLKQQALDHLHINHMGIKKKTKLLACESIYWANINNDIENIYKIVPHVLHFSRHNPRTK